MLWTASWATLETVSQSDGQEIPRFCTECEMLLPYWQESATGFYPEPDETSLQHQTLFPKMYLLPSTPTSFKQTHLFRSLN
jgi:hypothetical protein